MQLPVKIIEGTKLMEQWGMLPVDLVTMMMNHRLGSVCREIGVKGWIDENQDAAFSLVLKKDPDISGLIFKLSDVLRLEKKYRALTSESDDLLRGKELMKRWGKTEVEILDIMENCFLVAVDPVGVPMDSFDLDKLISSECCSEADLLFRKNDIEKLEKEYDIRLDALIPLNSKGKKLRPNQRHKLHCRQVAEQIWKSNPTITIADMAFKDEINKACEGKIYAEKTIRDWIKDLCPDRSPGRRPKNKQLL